MAVWTAILEIDHIMPWIPAGMPIFMMRWKIIGSMEISEKTRRVSSVSRTRAIVTMTADTVSEITVAIATPATPI